MKVGLALLPKETIDYRVYDDVERPAYIEAVLLTIIRAAMQANAAFRDNGPCSSKDDVLSIIELMKSPRMSDLIQDIAIGTHRRTEPYS